MWQYIHSNLSQYTDTSIANMQIYNGQLLSAVAGEDKIGKICEDLRFKHSITVNILQVLETDVS